MTATATPAAQTSSAGNLIVLVSGVLLGVALGPWVLGRIQPDTYARLFPDRAAAQQALIEFEAGALHLRTSLESTGATPVAVQEFDAQQQPLRLSLHQQLTNARRAGYRLHALMLALLGVMAVEFALGAHPGLATARAALAALWLALLLAQPTMLRDISLPLAGLALVIALAAALVPLRRTSTEGPSHDHA